MRAALQYTSGTQQVLLIDETATYYDRLSALFENFADYHLQLCNSTESAFHVINTSIVDSIIVNCCSSPYPCETFVAYINQHYPDTPIIVLAEQISIDQGDKLIAAQAIDYLSAHDLTADTLLRSLRYAVNTQQKNAEIQQLRQYDALTNVGNRHFFYRTLLQTLSKVPQGSHQVALLTIDLDGFRKFNTRFGVAAGDTVVQELGLRILSCLKSAESLARLGSDEFAVIIECEAGEDLEQLTCDLTERLLSRLKSGYPHSGANSSLPCSIGIAMAPQQATHLDELVRKATLARISAKQVHGCSYSLYRDSMEKDLGSGSDLEPELVTALRAGQFSLYYQPRIDLQSHSIVGAEALIRWHHPTRGLIMPGDFIHTCEQNGLIVPIGYWVIHQAGLHLQALKKQGLQLQRLGVNLSFRQFQDEHLVDTIRRIIQQNRIDTSVLEFELTESAIFNDEEHVLACIETLAQEGITFSLDDFGTGYSSFSLLHKLPISALKIDRSFISQVNESKEAAEIVRTIISLAQNMKMNVIAEGVETREQLEFLGNHQCDQIQGYYYSPPVAFEEFVQMLRNASN